MFVYELHKHAGSVNYIDWHSKGIRIPIFDIDGTLTEHGSTELEQKVIKGLIKQDFADIYPEIAIVTNNLNAEHINLIARKTEQKLGVRALTVSIADGYARKPHPVMGQIVANYYDVLPEQIGVVGDRRISDVSFGRSLGAGAIALCAKVGDLDAPFVPLVRVGEKISVYFDLMTGRALQED
jgi:FMN phosphatase YigB (HAD superfamily)